MRITIYNRCHFNRVFHRLQAYPDTRKTRQRPTIQPVIHHLLHTRRADNRHTSIDHRKFRLVQNG